MIVYYLRQALRSVRKNQGFALLNIAGFALGLSVFMLILFYVFDEWSYDKFNTNHERIYRVDTELKYGGVVSPFAIAAPPVAEALKTSFPEVVQTARITPAQNLQFKKEDEIIREDRVLYADESVFDIFSFPILYGSASHALSRPESIIITASVAKKYFNTQDAVGRLMLIENDSVPRIVSAVIEALPEQSHFHADIFLPLQFLPNAHNTAFNQFTFTTYALLNKQDASIALAPKLDSFIKDHLGSNMNVADFEKGGNYIRLVLTPLDDIHLYSNKQRELEANSDSSYVYIFVAAASLILILACINFTNLFTARSANRGREVGVRKVLGSLRTGIMLQFLTESLVMTTLSVLAALLLATLFLPAFNSLSGKHLELTWNSFFIILPVTLVIILFTTLLAGVYPAFYLSAFKPVSVLKGTLAAGFRQSSLRSVLVVVQFSIATILVVSTFVILHQLQFIRNKSLGFNREQVLLIHNVGTIANAQLMKEDALQLSGVMNASLSSYLPTGGARWRNSISSPGQEGLMAEFWSVDTDYIPTLQMKLAEGRNFSKDLATDSSGIIINKAAAAGLGINDDPLGKNVTASNGVKYEVVGVIDDFNFSSLRDNVTPLVMILNNDWRASLVVRLDEAHLTDIVSEIELLWKKHNPGHVYEFSMMDADFENIYFTEQRMEKLFQVFAALAVVIAGIGLFGLSAYAAEQRTREMAVRKVLGATVSNLFSLLSMSFIKLLVIAIAVSIPIAWMITERWLSGFAFHVDLTFWIFLLAATLILFIGVITITFQLLKVALQNPADNLRVE